MQAQEPKPSVDRSSSLEQATGKFYTVLEPGQIGDEDATIKDSNMCMHTSTKAKT